MKEIKTIEQGGYVYHISYDDEMSKARSSVAYTRYKVYHIRTDRPSWCGSILASLIGDYSMSKGLRDMRLKDTNNSIEVALKPYHTIEFDEEKDWYTYTIVFPYDD